MHIGNLRHGIPHLLPDELVTTLVERAGVRVERIVSRGHTSPADFWYDQDEHELVLLVQGRARILVEGHGELDMSPGDWLDLPAHTRHRVTFTDRHADTIWLAVFSRPT
jgi:cupin 2 domain-containing protein